LIAVRSAPASALRSYPASTGTSTDIVTPPAVSVTLHRSPTTTGPKSTRSRVSVAGLSSMEPARELLASRNGRPACAPSVEMVSVEPDAVVSASALKSARPSISAARLEATAARLAAPVTLFVMTSSPTVRVTVQMSVEITAPFTSKVRDTDRAANGARPSAVVKSTPAWLMTIRAPPSEVARKLPEAPALMAAARPAAIFESVSPDCTA
jgi:hypothetical protein